MKPFNKYKIFFLIMVSIVLLVDAAEAGPFIAYSMREAERNLKELGRSNPDLIEMGGITRIGGLVYDIKNSDLIVIGQANKGEKKVTLDDFVVALRARLIHNVWPEVSIDKTPETKETGKQNVRFEGGITNTQFGKDLLESDIILKKLALELLPADVWGVRSYFAMSVERAKMLSEEENISTRFWFYPMKYSPAGREGVFIIKELRVGVQARVIGAGIKGKPVTEHSKIRDEVGERFAALLSANYDDISLYYPEIARVKKLLDLVALADGIHQFLSPKPDMNYWLYGYKIPQTETLKDYPLLKREERVPERNKIRVIEVDGGVELKLPISRLQARLKEDGDITAIRDLVIMSRPKGNPLKWGVHLEGWHIPGYPEKIIEDESTSGFPQELIISQKPGCSMTRQISTLGTSGSEYKTILPPPTSSPSFGLPKFDLTDRLIPQKYSNNVGGVMLRDVAKIAGDAKVDLTSGNFSLIVDGENARLSPEVYRKFITALWSVYYSKEDPGISIDPIGCSYFDPNDPERDEKLKKCLKRYEKKEEKHLVRYIGKVINTDLGRVMREADYLMKKWSVGTEKPNILGFKNPDEYRGRKTPYVGGWSRFWFVPENMKFKQGEDMLLFEDGRMTVKTEFMFRNEKGTQADPYNEKFARFFTENYGQITAKYPVYQELFDYAKMVSLAKYLKEQGIPLFWFLMANKDLVITEDSPGTVDALAKGSDYYKNLYIIGGVDLGFKGNYVYDPQAVSAINEAVSKLPTNVHSKTSLSSDKSMARPYSEPFSFDLGKQSYTVVPQHSLTSGKDRRGIRYQTDLAFKSNGGPGLELVRYFNPRRQDSGEFGKGWHMLIPYRVKPTGGKREFLNALIPEKMVVENLLTGEQEVLTFSTDRYSIAGYVPEKLESSQVIGLFLMSDASFRLADKLGNEFWFNQAGYLTDMRFSRDHHFHFEYFNGITKAFEKDIYQVMPADQEQMEFLNVLIPKRMRVVDLINGGSEDLIFSDRGRIAGYIPEDIEKSRFKILALMSNLSFRLLDKRGNEVVFSPSGSFDGMIVSLERPIVKSVSQGEHRIDFKLTIDKSGKIMIASAHLSGGGGKSKPTYVVKYHYDDEGRLYNVKGSVTEVAQLQDPPVNRIAALRQPIDLHRGNGF